MRIVHRRPEEDIMQTKNQWNGPKNWKVVAGVGTAAALGFAGIAFAGTGDLSGVPDPIALQRQVITSQAPSTSTTSRITLATTAQPQAFPSTSARVTLTAPEQPSPSPALARVTQTTVQQPVPSPATTVHVTQTAGDDDLNSPLDDISPDTPDPVPDLSPDTPDVAIADVPDVESPDTPDVESVDVPDALDSADSSIDS